MIERVIMNGREVRVTKTPIGRKYDDLINRESHGNVIFETWQRANGTKYQTSRAKTPEEMRLEKKEMLISAIADWGFTAKQNIGASW